jgi:hypothetical protein
MLPSWCNDGRPGSEQLRPDKVALKIYSTCDNLDCASCARSGWVGSLGRLGRVVAIAHHDFKYLKSCMLQHS